MIKKLIIVFAVILSAAVAHGQTGGESMSLVDIQKASEQIRAKEKELAVKEQELAALQDRLKAMEEDLTSREENLKKMRQDITALLNQLNTDNDKELDRLAKVYSSAKPKEVAAILIKMDVSKSAALVRRMTAMNAGRIMAEIAKQDPSYASALTSYMVGAGPNTSAQQVTVPLSGQ